MRNGWLRDRVRWMPDRAGSRRPRGAVVEPVRRLLTSARADRPLRTVVLAAVATAVVLSGVATLVVWRVDHRHPDERLATSPALVGSIALERSAVTPGTPLVATIRMRADRPLTLSALMISVRDAEGRTADGAGRPYDFPDLGRVRLGQRQQTLTVGQRFFARGTYVYYLRYRQGGGDWHDLPPYQSFTVS